MFGFTGTTNILHPSYSGMGTSINASNGMFGKIYAPDEEIVVDEKSIGNSKNENYPINNSSIMDLMKQQQKEQWDREDAIRKETQEREDTAYQRAVADMEKAGINPNLINAQPASSGGGITTATGMDSAQGAQYSTEINKLLEEWKTELNNDTEISQNAKDRWSEFGQRLVQGAINVAALYLMSKFKK